MGWIIRRCLQRNFGRAALVLAAMYFCVQLSFLLTRHDSEMDAAVISAHLPKSLNERTTTSVKLQLQETGSVAMWNRPPLLYNPDLYFKPVFNTFLHGSPRKHKGLFTIGIPTTRRPNTGKIYLIQTLDSLLNSTVDKDKVKINIVVLIADDNRTYSHELSKILYTRYQEHVQSGFITIIQTCNCIYPDLNGIKTTFKDSTERLIWRAKQNIDFAFLMLFCRNMSQYYVQIEDDVISSIDFVRDMEAFVDSIPQPWFLLECSRLGFIGKIFKSADLQAMALYLLANYDEMPCDMLLGKFRGLRGQKKPIHSNYSLFQHIGRFSSLKNKLMPSVDRLFKDTFNQSLRVVNVPMGDNPDVNLTTSIEQYSNYTLDNAYDNDDSTFFWGVTPKKSDHFTLRFHSAQNISSIIILSGSPVSRDDTFTNTVLEYREYNDTKYLTGSEGCEGTFIKMAELVEGDLDTDAMGTSIPLNICCLRIRVIKNLKHWVKLREIRVYLLQRR